MLVFAAVDIRKGRCVRLLQGRPEDEKMYWEQPWSAALHWQHAGARALHVVDLDAALGQGENTDAVGDLLARVSIPVQVGGGLRDSQQVQAILALGAARAVVGTRAASEPQWAVGLCGSLPGQITIALDARDGKVAVEGWQRSSGLDVAELALRLQEGRPAAFLYTDVSRDGMLSHPNFEAVKALVALCDVPVIASGGVASLEDIRRLGECGADAVIVGKALYEHTFSLPEANEAAAPFCGRLSAAPPRSA